ncbi:TetR/AcrR family transcriptional regulator [Nocardioides daejeonensis]|uniref:TetR/AcrR family transcriptional regulator n=1 Tax=Nocardioides daejeonensis TaxID=1046556 RepID=UPI000D74B212|nr:TetR/AcrR family transcriptional regulator [Nocardioides daejeonensis]
MSVRERNKARVRQEILDAAWRLFADRGYAAVTTEEIASAAGVSTSTYFRYVPTKEDLLLAPVLDSATQLVALFAEQPDGLGGVRALAATIHDRTAQIRDRDLRRWRSAMRTAPEVIDRVTLIGEAQRAALTREMARRLGEPEDALRPALVVDLLVTAAAFAYRRWLAGSRESTLVDTIDAALGETIDGPWR